METSRLVFRSVTEPEVPVYAAAGSDPEAQRWLGWTPADIVRERRRRRLLRSKPGTRPATRFYPQAMLARRPRARARPPGRRPSRCPSAVPEVLDLLIPGGGAAFGRSPVA
ncbi:hypothetical protein [Actinomadura verrucosospora]|uniref:Uncharacterized protein n=1 Tax=Actinomadura verrucosospora TaxID=46165 RepID=A0A7D3ZNI0_ACTVE|nr:hypothetical protein [Actinomadura verrucosospora]QKG24861.1 hypothetical protein ACTIVE_6512 [Actinomadura verrucosospora]